MLSRVNNIAADSSGTTKYAAYLYLGDGTIVSVTHPAVSNGLTLSYGSSGTYGGWDRFGRVIDQKWTNGAQKTTLDEYTYTYDRASNRLTRGNALNSALSESYSYDGLDRLIDTNRNGSDLQSWNLDSLGNWASFTDTGGTQTRTANAANEITGISGSWIDPVYDDAGNMISGPKAGDETTRLHYKYDAWNRLVQVNADNNGEPGTLIATYEYDGRNFRVSKDVAATSATDDFYYNESWQALEVRRNSDADPMEQYVWDQRYIDAPVVRWYDSNTDGTLDNTLYYTNDANMNVTGLVDASDGSVAERYAYDPNGKPTFYNYNWTDIGSSAKSNWRLFGGAEKDEETNLFYQRMRYRDWSLNWLTRDPAEDGAHLYEYARGNSVNRLDPSGLISVVTQNKDIVAAWEIVKSGCSQSALDLIADIETMEKCCGQKVIINIIDESHTGSRFREVSSYWVMNNGQPQRVQGHVFEVAMNPLDKIFPARNTIPTAKALTPGIFDELMVHELRHVWQAMQKQCKHAPWPPLPALPKNNTYQLQWNSPGCDPQAEFDAVTNGDNPYRLDMSYGDPRIGHGLPPQFKPALAAMVAAMAKQRVTVGPTGDLLELPVFPADNAYYQRFSAEMEHASLYGDSTTLNSRRSATHARFNWLEAFDPNLLSEMLRPELGL